MSWRSAIIALAAALAVAGCQVRPLYLDAATGGPLSPTPDLMAIAVDPPRDRTEQVLTNELKFLFRGDGSNVVDPRYRLRFVVDVSDDRLAVELEQDLPAAILVTLNATFILSEIATERTLLTGASTATASYDFSSQRFANVRAEKDARERAARSMAENIATRIAAYFAAKRSDT
ncbi:LPS assembly lipoprotein LptE [Acuticoccus sp. I52.16.1]|uniref:LPS assembly lipoprotein LptE n=1 Tax=Acuticoccus sp. I52.16.1 TaxID=2928472 RepID=UPI001FD39FAF|nr:LPS assembly lipoprotein LptE [Acuticoccus sp. I52.16.1]UOM36438.1 LPS assembly lipoprotein LptE [Acuticoccus sp. I52.16.1]